MARPSSGRSSEHEVNQQSDCIRQETMETLESYEHQSVLSCPRTVGREMLSTGGEVGSASENEAVEMELDVWKDLPEELLTPILYGLPLQSIFRLRSVCKKWNALLHSASFFEMCAQVRTQAPFCIRQADDGYAVYNPSSNGWLFWPYSFLFSKYSSAAAITKSAASLLLFEGYGDEGRVLYVANPINSSQKKLSLIPELQDSFTSAVVGMVMDRKTGLFNILAVDHGVPDEVFLYDYYREEDEDADDPFRFYIYDSKRNAWEMTGSWQRGVKQFFQCPTFLDGCLYCLTSDVDAFHLSASPPSYHVYRVGQDAWYEVQADIPGPLNFAFLFETRGHLMLAGGTGNMSGLTSVHIWRLDEASLKWLEVQAMPAHLVQALSVPMEPHFRSHFSCVANADYVCVTSFSRKLQHRCTTVMCNLHANYWWLLPNCPRRSYPGSFLLEPRLDVVI